jgi:hypothetical protein
MADVDQEMFGEGYKLAVEANGGKTTTACASYSVVRP